MPDKQTLAKLTRFATAFREARDRNANEADTVMLLIRFFDEVLGYDPLKGDITKELAIKDRYCDVALKVDGVVRLIIEVKAASQKSLVEKHIEQAENYASRAGLNWVLLTNGIQWKLFHLTFNEGEGIAHDLAFDANLPEDLLTNADALWGKLELLTRAAVRKSSLEDYWAQRKILSPESVVRVLFHEEVLREVRRLLRKDSEAMLGLEEVFNAVRDVIAPAALAQAGDLGITRKRKRRRKVQKTDAATGKALEVEIEEDVPEVVVVQAAPAAVPAPELTPNVPAPPEAVKQ